MPAYSNTVVRDRPELVGRWLYLARPDGIGLADLGAGTVRFTIDAEGAITVEGSGAASLAALGMAIYGERDPSVTSVIRRAVTQVSTCRHGGRSSVNAYGAQSSVIVP